MVDSGTFRELVKLSKEGIACDQCNLGVAYALGDGTTKNREKAAKWYRKAAERNDAIAQVLLGDCYYLGEGVTEDKEAALRWYRKAADNGNRLAGYKLELTELPEDIRKAGIRLLRWYTYIVVLGIEKARRYYEQESSEGKRPDMAAFRKWLDINADGTVKVRSERKANETLIEQLKPPLNIFKVKVRSDGKTNETNTTDTIEELGDAEIVKAAIEGNIGAQCILELPRLFSVETAEDVRETVQWYRSAAEQGDSCAQYVMGNIYDLGIGVDRDTAQAIEWYKKAAIQGNTGAQRILGSSYYFGRGVAKDKAEAVKWYSLAAEQGDNSAAHIVQRLTGQL